MNLSEKSRQNIDSCRFCWMCRHICPIGNATGQERNTARARAMILSMVNRGSVELTPDIMDNNMDDILNSSNAVEKLRKG